MARRDPIALIMFLPRPRGARPGVLFSPDAGERGLDLLLETGDEFAVGVVQRLPGFNLRRGAVRNGATNYYLFSRPARAEASAKRLLCLRFNELAEVTTYGIGCCNNCGDGGT